MILFIAAVVQWLTTPQHIHALTQTHTQRMSALFVFWLWQPPWSKTEFGLDA